MAVKFQRGIVGFEVNGVIARFTRKQSADLEMVTRRIPALRLAAVLAAHIRTRVRDKWRTAGPWKGYSRSGVRKIPRKIRTIGGYQYKYPSSASIPRPGLGAVTGTMWRNMEVVAAGRYGARMQFRGTGPGTGLTNPWPHPRLRFATRTVFDRKVRNQVKANALFRELDLHVLEPTNSEGSTMGQVIGATIGRDLLYALDGKNHPEAFRNVAGAGLFDQSLAAKLQAAYRG